MLYSCVVCYWWLFPKKEPNFEPVQNINMQTTVWRSTGKRSSCSCCKPSVEAVCDDVHTKLSQLPDVLSSEERDMASKLLQLGQSHLMVNIYRFHFVLGGWGVVGLVSF